MKRLLINIVVLLFLARSSPTSAIDDRKIIPPSAPIPLSFFGMHIHHMVSPNGTMPLTPWPSVSIPEWRLWDARVTWPDLEPAKGQWRFNVLDKSVEMAEAHHTEVMLTLGFTPQWASARPHEPVGYNPGWAAEPTDIEDWRTFVRTVATRYKGRIRIYEVWNEANLNNHYWTGSVQQMVALVHTAHDIIKTIDPTAIIVSPSATTLYGLPWFREFLSQGGGQYVDVIGYHFYVTPWPPEAMVALVEKVKQAMRANGVGNKPIWNTESGWLRSRQPISEEVGAAYLARSYILLWAEGVQRFYWYAWDDSGVSVPTTRTDNRTPTLAGEAFGTMQKWLVGARMDWCDQDPNQTWTCQLSRRGSLQWIVWNPDRSETFVPAASWHVESVLPLFGAAHPFNGAGIVIDQIPQLLIQTDVIG
jgi:hypothetical protein